MHIFYHLIVDRYRGVDGDAWPVLLHFPHDLFVVLLRDLRSVRRYERCRGSCGSRLKDGVSRLVVQYARRAVACVNT